jgi:hypothetical protein
MCFGKKFPKNCNTCLTVSVKHCLDFSFVFSAPLPEETCFQQVGSSAVEVPARLYWDLLTSGRYQENSALLRKRI